MSTEQQYIIAGKLGPWARCGCRGERYLKVGQQEKPEYIRIDYAEKHGDSWRYIAVLLDDYPRALLHGCGTNVYRRD